MKYIIIHFILQLQSTVSIANKKSGYKLMMHRKYKK